MSRLLPLIPHRSLPNRKRIVTKLAAEFRANKKKNFKTKLAAELRNADSHDADEVLHDLRIEVGQWYSVTINATDARSDYESERLWDSIVEELSEEGMKTANASQWAYDMRGNWETWEVRAIDEADAHAAVHKIIRYTGAVIQKITPRYPETRLPSLWKVP